MPRAITATPTDLSQRLDRLADELRQAGVLTDPAWRDALHAVPRHLFIPPRAWIGRGSQHVEIDRDRDPQAWWDAVYTADEAIVTQFDDRPGPPEGQGEPSSSSPAPNVQLEMLQLLDVRAGMRVLEIGTGTGWNAALLAHRLGDANVISVEIDPDIAYQAELALAASGHNPIVDVADGRLGYPRNAPYDRIIATCAVTEIPYSWVNQTRPGGIILSPWVPRTRLGGDPLARLVVNDSGTASGRFVSNVSFMQLRQQRRSNGGLPPSLRDDPPTQTAVSSTTIDPVTVLFRNHHAAFPARLLLGDGTCGFAGKSGPHELIVWLSDPATGSWARVHRPARFSETLPAGTRFVAEQYGPRRLWDEIEAVYHWWHQAGQPAPQRFGLTVTRAAQVIWLDTPDQPVVRLPAPTSPAFLDRHEVSDDAPPSELR